MSWVQVLDADEQEKALSLARGDYQRGLILGSENLSGSTLRGRAKEYGGRYAESRRNLLSRLTVNGVRWKEVRGEHNKRILVIGG